ncbi:hypothetical protein QEN19_003919 [Hanseniaspora menglaensis]
MLRSVKFISFSSKKFASNIIFNENNSTLKNLVKISSLLNKDNKRILVNYIKEDEVLAEIPEGTNNFTKIFNIQAKDVKEPEIVAGYLKEILNSEEDVSNVIFNTQTLSKAVFPRLAAQLNTQPTNDIVKIVDENTFIKPMFAGNILSKVEYETSNKAMKILTFRTANFPLSESEKTVEFSLTENTAKLPTLSTEIPINKFVKVELPQDTGRPDISQAKIIVSGGRGLKTKENFENLITPLADSFANVVKYGNTKASIGATRAVVDLGFVNNSLQIGQTGKIVQPELYIACGISGAIQHLAGMKGSKVIVGINKEEGQPLEQVSDYTLIGDVDTVLPELTAKISSL